ncbi:MAG: carbonic anhydrase [Phycisphaerae bacterium]|jgi:carbonic anhydrase
MQKLVDGVHTFQRGVFGSQRAFFEKLVGGQRPMAVFITCSDSRISPNLITQTQPGDLFILRNAGNIIPAYGAGGGGGETATIEFAVSVLKVPDIIICGHSHCGAMKALLGPPAALEDMPATRAWLNNAEATRRIIREKYQHLEGGALLTACVEENVLVQLENLRTHPVIAAGLARKTVNLHGWVYKLETGEVFVFNPEQGQFLPLADHRTTPVEPPVSAASNLSI